MLVIACAPDNGQVGEETIQCKAVSMERIDRDEISPLGFSPAEILSFSEGTHSGTLQWADSMQSEVTINMQFTGEATYQVRDWVDENGGLAEQQLEIDCPNVMELEMEITISSTDGRLNESWPVQLRASSTIEATTSVQPQSFVGTLDVASFAPEGDFIRHRAFVDVDFQNGILSGRLSGQAESENGDVVSALSYDIATVDL